MSSACQAGAMLLSCIPALDQGLKDFMEELLGLLTLGLRGSREHVVEHRWSVQEREDSTMVP